MTTPKETPKRFLELGGKRRVFSGPDLRFERFRLYWVLIGANRALSNG